MSNRLTLDQLQHLSVREILDLPLEQIADVIDEVEDLEERVKSAKVWLANAMHLRFGDTASQLRKAMGKDTGVVHITADGYDIEADLGKKVDWNQKGLEKAIETIQSWNEPISQYVDVTYKVSETKYKAWPKSIKKVFEPARTVSTGKPTYKIKVKLEKEAA